PDYVKFIKAVKNGNWKQQWVWSGPDWKDINNHDTSAVGFLPGSALSPAVQSSLDSFIEDLASGKVQLFKGPLDYQDGTPFLKSGETASDKKIWYMKQLLKGMEGQSKAK
ncbi:MAG: BMP family ABC transporter substrate-binding protein, partial [Desulfobacterales bacterium]|nr:BMP family ABC transporter substrate-binding protein [Desulfobacterales bacterium]